MLLTLLIITIGVYYNKNPAGQNPREKPYWTKPHHQNPPSKSPAKATGQNPPPKFPYQNPPTKIPLQKSPYQNPPTKTPPAKNPPNQKQSLRLGTFDHANMSTCVAQLAKRRTSK